MDSIVRYILLFWLFCGPAISHAQDESATSILLFGDSIIAGYGLGPEDALPVQLEKSLRAKGLNVRVINGGVSGDTTSSGRSRIEWTIKKHNPDLVLLALGGNDVLRGFAPTVTRENLDAMLNILKKKNVATILSSVTAPVNLGLGYVADFNKIYPDLAGKYNVPIYPFLLAKTFGKQTLMQDDQIHPSATGVKQISQDLTVYLVCHLERKSGC